MEVLGVLIARISGMPLPDYLHKRIFAPLGMKDTGFWVPQDKLYRLAACPACVPGFTGRRTPDDPARDSRWSQPPVFPSGGAGLVSTASDYWKFAQMLVNYGVLGNVQIISRRSAELMTTNRLTAEQLGFPPFTETSDNVNTPAMPGTGFGLSLSIVEDTAKQSSLSSTGNFHWAGAFGTDWVGDRCKNLVLIIMTQSGYNPKLMADFTDSAYQTIRD